MPRPSPHPPGEIRWRYSIAELWADGVIHVLGVVLATVGAIAFLVAMPKRSAAEIAAVAIYLATLCASIGVSATYNIWPVSRMKWFLRRLDHSAIYLLIAGTYTPLMTKLGSWWLLAVVWGVAAFGVALKIARPGQFDRFSIVLYLALGWSGVAVCREVVAAFPPVALWLIGLGGVTYSFGVIFHVWEQLRFQNAIWHGFVLTAATTHYAAIWAVICGAGQAP